jgi:hypothetical protein
VIDLEKLRAECLHDTAPPRASGMGTITLEKNDLREILDKVEWLQKQYGSCQVGAANAWAERDALQRIIDALLRSKPRPSGRGSSLRVACMSTRQTGNA